MRAPIGFVRLQKVNHEQTERIKKLTPEMNQAKIGRACQRCNLAEPKLMTKFSSDKGQNQEDARKTGYWVASFGVRPES